MRECSYSEVELKKFLEDFFTVSGIIIGIHNSGETDAAIQGDTDKKNFCRFCKEKSDCFADKCFEIDKRNLEIVQKRKKVIIYKCHMGLTEAIIPIIGDNDVICIIFMGQVICSELSEEDFNEKVNKIKQIDPFFFEKTDIYSLYDAYINTTHCTSNVFKRYTAIAELCARSIYNNRWIKYRTLSISEAFRQYISDYITMPVTINKAAAILNISASHLSRIIKKETGMTFTEYVLREKVKEAERLLADTDIQIKNIAVSLGFEDSNYFSRVFKKYTNTTCGKYRTSAKKNQ
jgi:AraC-like DNA-binding protein